MSRAAISSLLIFLISSFVIAGVGFRFNSLELYSIIIDNAKQTVAPIAQPVVAPSSRSVADELAKLAKLKADGILTEEEFQAQKSKLLGL